MRRRSAALFALFLGFGVACGERPLTTESEPPGALLVAETAGLRRLLDPLVELEGTPLAQRARALADSLPACARVEAQAPEASLEALLSSLTCAESPGRMARLERERGDAALAFAWPLADGRRLRGVVTPEATGSVALRLQVPREAAAGASALLLPGPQTPGPTVLNAAERLLHLRLRPARLDIASLVPHGGQADQLFRLKGELFAGAVLDGTWESAVYLPEPGHDMPRVALALGFRQRAAAVHAMEAFLRDLQATWPLRRSYFEVGEASGACLLDLRILPDFAPCYVATADALVLGWNPRSLRHALAGTRSPDLANGGLVVELARFPDADRLLAEAGGEKDAPLALHYPWRRLRAAGRGDDETVQLELRLEAPAGA